MSRENTSGVCRRRAEGSEDPRTYANGGFGSNWGGHQTIIHGRKERRREPKIGHPNWAIKHQTQLQGNPPVSHTNRQPETAGRRESMMRIPVGCGGNEKNQGKPYTHTGSLRVNIVSSKYSNHHKVNSRRRKRVDSGFSSAKNARERIAAMPLRRRKKTVGPKASSTSKPTEGAETGHRGSRSPVVPGRVAEDNWNLQPVSGNRAAKEVYKVGRRLGENVPKKRRTQWPPVSKLPRRIKRSVS